MLRLVLGLVAVSLPFAGCGSDRSQGQAGSPSPTATPETQQTAAPAEAKRKARLGVHNRRKTTQSETITVKGEVTEGAIVTVRGDRARVNDGRFSKKVKLRVGENKFTVVARHPDRRTSRKRLRITREAPQPTTESNAPTPQQGDPCAGAVSDFTYDQCRSAAGLPPTENRPTPPKPPPCPPGTHPPDRRVRAQLPSRPLQLTTRQRTPESERLATTTRTSAGRLRPDRGASTARARA